MGCCGGGTQTLNNAAKQQQAPPVVTGYAIDMPDGRVITYLTRDEAEGARGQYNLDKPVREVLGWR